MQDDVTLDYASAIYNFQTSVKDESGNGNHGTASGIVYGEDKWDGYAVGFDGINDYVTIPDSSSLDLSGKFEIVTWLKWLTTSEEYVFQREVVRQMDLHYLLIRPRQVILHLR